MSSGQVSGEIQCVRKTVTRGLTHPLPVLWCCDPPWNLGSSTRWGWLDRATGLKQGQRDTVAFRVIFFPVAIMTLEMEMQQRACNSADYSSTCIVCLTSATCHQVCIIRPLGGMWTGGMEKLWKFDQKTCSALSRLAASPCRSVAAGIGNLEVGQPCSWQRTGMQPKAGIPNVNVDFQIEIST